MGAALVVSMFGAAGASASFHLMKIREVSSGTGTANSSYVEIQMDAPGQNFLSNGATLLRCDATCSSPTAFMPFTDVATGDNQEHGRLRGRWSASGSKDFTIAPEPRHDQGRRRRLLPERAWIQRLCFLGQLQRNSTLVTDYGTGAGNAGAGADLRDGAAPNDRPAGARRRSRRRTTPTTARPTSPRRVTPNPRRNSSPPTETPARRLGPRAIHDTAPRSPKHEEEVQEGEEVAPRTAKKCKKRK